MARLVWILLFVSALASAEERPTRAALRKAFEQGKASVVEVIGAKGRGPGVIVSANGHVVTSLHYVGRGNEKARVRFAGKLHDASVVLANADLHVVVLALPEPTEYPSAAVNLDKTFVRGGWVVGVERTSKGKSLPKLGQLKKAPTAKAPFVTTNLALPPGSPLLDASGKVLAVAVGPGHSTARALPVAVLKEQLLAVLASNATP